MSSPGFRSRRLETRRSERREEILGYLNPNPDLHRVFMELLTREFVHKSTFFINSSFHLPKRNVKREIRVHFVRRKVSSSKVERFLLHPASFSTNVIPSVRGCYFSCQPKIDTSCTVL